MKDTARLRRAILTRSARVGIVGQGYVGLSLACATCEADFETVGVDVDATRVDALVAGDLVVPGVAEAIFRAAVASGRLTFTSDASSLADCDIAVICVPTPLRDGAPDLSHVRHACESVLETLRPGRLVILESTTYPGTTDELVRPILEGSGLSSTRDFLIAYSPERIDPGNDEFGFRRVPRVVGGITPEATGLAAIFYGQLVDKVVQVASCRTAELAKLLENAFRHVNIALANEMAVLCHEMGIDVWEVVEAAASKPFGFMPFYPGPGVGGHCIPLDPAYLAWQIRRDAGRQFRILEQAQDVNAMMPAYVAGRIGEALNELGIPLKGASVFLLGVAYKPDVGDVRESPALKILSLLERRGARVSFHDPHVMEVSLDGVIRRRSELTARGLAAADCVAVLTDHSAYDLGWVADHARLLFDVRNALGHESRANVVKL